jgi:DNA-binding NtrC family response regulator
MTTPSHSLELVVYLLSDRRVEPLPARGTVRIGRGADNDIRIDHSSVSRRHLTLTLGEQIHVVDENSANGTILYPVTRSGEPAEETDHTADGQLKPKTPVPLAPSQMLRIGNVLVMLRRRQATSPSQSWRPPVLCDPETLRIYDVLKKAAPTEMSVLILGETGSGKEVFAEAVHRLSPRAEKPFVRLHCAALTESLLESELFGHERGAFTGATGAKMGLLESANGGTVFLDEIGELPLAMQVKLLRVLEDRLVTPVGSTRARPIDVRFVAATNRNLRDEIAAMRFREDLFFRINGVSVVVPPLRQRRAEIMPLANYFLEQVASRRGASTPRLDQSAVDRIVAFHWPGNARELRNVVERAYMMSGGTSITAEHLSFEEHRYSLPDSTEWHDVTSVTSTALGSLRAMLEQAEKDRILQALEQCGGNQTRAAKMLGVARRTLVNRIEAFGLPRPRKS